MRAWPILLFLGLWLLLYVDAYSASAVGRVVLWGLYFGTLLAGFR